MPVPTPAPVFQYLGPNRRRAYRYWINMQITLSFEGEQQWIEADAALLEMSRLGMQVRCDRIPRPDQIVMIGFMRHGRGLCAAAGHAVRFAEGGGFGVSFHEVSFTMRELLADIERATADQRAKLFAELSDLQVWISEPPKVR